MSTLLWSAVASSIVVPQRTMIKSSATTSIPDIPSTSSCVLCWNTTGAELTLTEGQASPTVTAEQGVKSCQVRQALVQCHVPISVMDFQFGEYFGFM